MKNKIKRFSLILVVIAIFTVLYSIDNSYPNKDFISLNIEALADDESGGIQFRCRCHGSSCYGGNAISFRPLCFSETIHIGGTADCTYYDSECY